ncbi:hypothetical protein LINPERPRIM_LOCUS37333, partial [Linum perenne]
AIVKLSISFKFPIQGACCNSCDPRCNVGHSSKVRTSVTCRASNIDTVLDSMERANGYGILEIIGSTPTERHGDDIHAIIDRSIESCQDVRVKALISIDRRPADLVSSNSGFR